MAITRRSATPLAVVVVLAVGTLVTADAVTGPAASSAARPTVAVALGDSGASGEGAGSYEPGTDQAGNFCHRSANAYIHRLAAPGIDTAVNLACSGAVSANLYLSGPSRYGEPSQVDRLAEVATEHDVKLVTVQVGANDDPGFSETVLECVVRWAVVVGPGCRDTIGASWPERVARMQPKVEKAVSDVRQVMRAAGYADSAYELVLVSYASPVTENMRRFTHAFEGCPIRIEDARWGRTVATVLLSEALREVAAEAGARFLDLSQAAEGHEACNRDVPRSQRWQTGLTVDVASVVDGVDGHLVQESFHTNAAGHAQVGRCLTEFYLGGERIASCRIGPDGALRPVAG